MLSHPLPIIALVVRYTTNKLVGRGVLLRPKSLVRGHYSVLPAVSRSYPDPQGKLPRVTLPCAAVHSINHSEEIKKELLARLACLIHAANVHSEPESNPSIDWLILPKQMYCRTGYHCRKATDIEGSFCTFKIVSFPPATLLRISLSKASFDKNRWCRSRSRAGRNRKRLTTKLSKIIS